MHAVHVAPSEQALAQAQLEPVSDYDDWLWRLGHSYPRLAWPQLLDGQVLVLLRQEHASAARDHGRQQEVMDQDRISCQGTVGATAHLLGGAPPAPRGLDLLFCSEGEQQEVEAQCQCLRLARQDARPYILRGHLERLWRPRYHSVSGGSFSAFLVNRPQTSS